jgi:hypothetical protein
VLCIDAVVLGSLLFSNSVTISLGTHRQLPSTQVCMPLDIFHPSGVFARPASLLGDWRGQDTDASSGSGDLVDFEDVS